MRNSKADEHLSARDLLWGKGHGNLEGGSNRGGNLGLHLMNDQQFGLVGVSSCGVQASQWSGVSRGAQAPGHPGFSSCSLWAPEHKLRNCGARA